MSNNLRPPPKTLSPAEQEVLRGADALLAARMAWEQLRDELTTHEYTIQTDFICLACHKRAQAFIEAVRKLSDRLPER